MGALTRPRPRPRPISERASRPGEGKGAAAATAAAAAAAALGWAGKEAAPCLQEDQLGPRVEAATEFLEVFHTPGPSSARARGLAGSGAECWLYCHGPGVRRTQTGARS